MMLCFIRHAIAADRESWNEEDESRPLTGEGAKKMKRVADALSLITKDFTHICSSPLTRARQTAKIVARKSGYSGKMLIWNELVPGTPPQRLQRKLQALSNNSKTKRPSTRMASRRAAASKDYQTADKRSSAKSADSVRVALVGHEPHLSQAVSYFLCGDPDIMSIDFKKSGVCCLEYEGKVPATLRWFVTPKIALSIADRR